VGDGSYSAHAAHFDGDPLSDYVEGSGSFSESGSTEFNGYSQSTNASTIRSLSFGNSLPFPVDKSTYTDGNATMKGWEEDNPGYTGYASINSDLNVGVSDSTSFEPLLGPGQARINTSMWASGSRWHPPHGPGLSTASSIMTAKVGDLLGNHEGNLTILPAGDIEYGDFVTLEIIFESGETGYDFWSLQLGDNLTGFFYEFQGGDGPGLPGQGEPEYFRTELILTVGTSYKFYYEASQSYNITTVGSGGQGDAFSSSLQLNVIPEPATLALLGLGSLILRKRKRA
jgi:hypothetical protein